jgi:tetratricopeptide (TPR) repeat protein
MTNSSRLSALCDKIIEAGWLMAVILVPLFFNVYSSRVFEPDKLTLLRTIALTMIAAWLIKWIDQRKLPKDTDRPDRVTRRTPVVLATLVLVIVYLISTVFSLVPAVSFLGSYQRLQGTYSTFSYIVIFAMILVHMRKREQLDRIVTTIVMTSLPIAFYGLLQHGNGTSNSSFDPLPWGGDVTVRVASNMGNAIFVAAYLIMAFFLTLGRVVESFRTILTEEESRVSDILRASTYIFIAALQLITFGFADSRGPLLGWLPGMFIFGLVGFIMLRVSLHSQANNGNATESEDAAQPTTRFPITVIDLIKAIAISIVSLAVAAGAGLILYQGEAGADTEPKISLIAVVVLLSGLLPILLVAGIRRTSARWLWTSLIIFAVVGGVFLAIINFSDHPFIVNARANGGPSVVEKIIQKLGTLFESEGGTGKVRTLIWEGSEKLVTPHAPLKFPDGTTDPFNAIRPLIGYGPESMYVAYNSFYPPDLAHHEARNASPDRSHNETWDSLVITGGLGFIAEQFLFISVFFFALKFIGWIPNRKAAITYIALMVVGGVGGAIGLMAYKGTKFFGVGWPGGVTAGVVAYVVLFALFHFQISRRVYAVMSLILIGVIEVAIFGVTFTSEHRSLWMIAGVGGGVVLFAVVYLIGQWAFSETAGQPIDISSHVFIIIALFGGILAHYLEISLAGIAIAATRTYFWTFAGLLIVVGLRWVPTSDEPAPSGAIGVAATPATATIAPVAVAQVQASVPRHKKKSKRVIEQARSVQATKRNTNSGLPAWFTPVLTMALIGTVIMMTLGYEFINNAPASGGVCSLKAAPQSSMELIANSLTHLPYSQNPDLCNSARALLMFGVTWLAGGLLSLTELRRRETLAAKDVWAAALSYFGISIGLTFTYWLMHAGQLMDLGRIVSNTQITTLPDLSRRVNELLTLADSVANLLSFFYFIVFVSIIGLAVSMMLQGRRTWFGKWATDFGALGAIVIVPLLIVSFNATNLNNIRADTVFKQADPLKAQGQWDAAIAHYKKVSSLQPNEDFYYLWMGAAYLEKANSAPADRPNIITPQTTFNSIMQLTFEQGFSLSRLDTLQVALTVLTHARNLNPLNTDHSANLARLYRRWADLETEPQAKRDRLMTSSDYYSQATTLSPQNAQLWNEWATVNLSLHDLEQQLQNDHAAADLAQAQSLLDHSLELDSLYEQTYLIRAQLDQFLGKNDEAIQEYQNALKAEPNSSDAWGGMTQILSAQGNYTAVETITLAFLQTHPTFVAGFRTLARNAYFPAGRLAEAINTQQQVIQLAGSDPNVWDDYRVLAIMLAQAGRFPEALQAAQTGLTSTPADKQAEIQSLIGQLQQQLSLGATLSNTGSITSPVPAPVP